jgi:hypothetical protein
VTSRLDLVIPRHRRREVCQVSTSRYRKCVPVPDTTSRSHARFGDARSRMLCRSAVRYRSSTNRGGQGSVDILDLTLRLGDIGRDDCRAHLSPGTVRLLDSVVDDFVARVTPEGVDGDDAVRVNRFGKALHVVDRGVAGRVVLHARDVVLLQERPPPGGRGARFGRGSNGLSSPPLAPVRTPEFFSFPPPMRLKFSHGMRVSPVADTKGTAPEMARPVSQEPCCSRPQKSYSQSTSRPRFR